MKSGWVAAVIGLVAAVAAFGGSVSAASLRVLTTQGWAEGRADEGANAFLGLPFAAAPVGDLRWRAPRPAAAWKGTKKALHFSASCPQSAPKAFGPYSPEFLIPGPVSEDCLYLNVWTPKGRAAHPLPILVWIHGGGFSSGSASVPIYEGARLARRGVVVVSINYRLGVLGFLATPDLVREGEGAGNFGLLDQVAALQWVSKNARAFGGDPARVTIAGQSAGAISVLALMATPSAHGLFSRAIAESGAGMGVDLPAPEAALARGAAVMKLFGAASISDLRRQPAARLSEKNWGMDFAPVPDGVVLTFDPQSSDQSFLSQVPLLTGFNADEAFMGGAPPTTPADFEAFAHKRFAAEADRLIGLYPHATADEAKASRIDLARDRSFAGLVLWARRRAALDHAPLYLYRYDHAYKGLDPARFGSFHTAEVPYLFGVLEQQRETTPNDRAISQAVQRRWVTFARTGAPGPDWSPYRPGEPRLMELGDRNGPRDAVSSPERFTLLAEFASQGGKLTLFDW